MHTLETVISPHRPTDPAKVAALVAAYEEAAEVTPIVVLTVGDGAYALCGSHRIAALREVFLDVELDDLDDYVLLVDGDELYELHPEARAIASELVGLAAERGPA